MRPPGGNETVRAMLPALLILVLPMVMLYPLWNNPVSAGEDDVVYYYPLRKMTGQALREGRWGLHNRLEATGAPLMADPQSAVMYPPTWLFAVADAKLAYSLSLFAAFSLAGAGAYLYLRCVGLVRPAATFGAVAFMFCGFFVGHRVHLAIINTAAFLPWGLWCIERLRTRASAAFAWMVPVVFLAIAAGHYPTLIHVGMIWSVYLLLRGRPFVRALAIVAAATVLAGAIASPQLHATAELLGCATRQRIGYATAGENSFFPPAGVLALFPFLMGSRTPNFFPQEWWGPWHLCEMLGYVGLVTLVAAFSAVRRLYRKPGRENQPDGPSIENPPTIRTRHGPIVRVWTWIVIGAGIWMLGYYLPTYKLIHVLPVLGIVRCPARMVLAVDMGLAVLAAVAIHVLSVRAESAGVAESLGRTVRRTAVVLLPALMLGVLVLLACVGAALMFVWPDRIPFFTGGATDLLAALWPMSPAVWVPLVAMAATMVVVGFWLARPGRRAAVLVVLLLADLFVITRFVDVPSQPGAAPNPEVSPAAAWLHRNGPTPGTYRVYGLSKSYHHRPAELLLPKTCESLGIATIANYGPFQSPAHARLFGFNVSGYNRNWAALIRRNYLLSLYNVRYVVAADAVHRRVIESVRIQPGESEPDAPELLGENWWLDRAELIGRTLRLRTAFLWNWSIAKQPVGTGTGAGPAGGLEPDGVYRISLEARAPDGGAANFLRAEVFQELGDGRYYQADELGLIVPAEQIGPQWRKFEWTFQPTPRLFAPESGQLLFRIFTMSERAIEVRRISLRKSRWDAPIDLGGRLDARGRIGAVYEDVTPDGLQPLRPGDPRVHIYRNRLCLPDALASSRPPATAQRIELLRTLSKSDAASVPQAPDVSIRTTSDPTRILLLVTMPALLLYAGIVAAAALGRGRRR